MFSVSVLASAGSCLLKATLQASSEKGTLLDGPHATLGIIAHQLVERAMRGIKQSGEAAFDELEQIFDSLMADARKRLSNRPETVHYSNLPCTMSPIVWSRKYRKIIDMAYESAKKASQLASVPFAQNFESFRFENLSRDGQWFEVSIEVPELRLKGRIDSLRRKGKEIKITDIKSGRVEDDNGEILESISKQILLYGLMASWLEPTSYVNLSILSDVEIPILFDRNVQDEILDWLRSRTVALSPGTVVPSDSISRVGPDCRWCKVRHRCAGYLREVPLLWRSNLDWTLPLDVWGEIERIDSKGSGLVDLTLWDAGRRRVKVFCLRESHVKGLSIGSHIWLFDLSASPRDIRGKTWRQPLNFYEIGDSDRDRAWTLQAFTDAAS